MNKRQRRKRIPFKVGQIYLDCANHPVRFTEVEPYWRGQELWGTSLLDGSSPRGCSLRHCDPPHVSEKQANAIIQYVQEQNSPRQDGKWYGNINLPLRLIPYRGGRHAVRRKKA